MTADLHVVGQSVERSDGVGFVTGRAAYTADLTFPGMLHLRMVRSPLHHARIRGVDLSGAERVKGFVRALTHEDVPHNVYTILGLIGVEPEEEFVLAVDRVRYMGEPIVAILAETEAAAIEAAAAVRLDLEELPAVFDMEEALAPGAPVVTHWGSNTFIYEGDTKRKVRLGDVEAGFAQADHVIEHVYRTSPIEHVPIETTGCIAVPEANGRFTVYTNTQAIYFSLDNTSIILQLQANRLRFIGGMVGGGFGGKVDVIVEPLATLGAMKTGRPVRYVYTRTEEMQVSSTRSAEIITIRDGIMADGTIVARKVTALVDCGAYSRQTPYAITKLAANAAGPYRIPNVWIDAYCVYTNRTPTSAMRGFGVTWVTFAHEVQMDRIAELVGPRPVDRPVPERAPQRRHEAAPQDRRRRDADRDDAGGGRARRPRAASGPAGDDIRATDAGRGTGADDGEAARHRHGRRQLPDRDEPRRRPLAGAHPRDDERLVQRRPRGDRPRPGAQDRRRPDRRRDAGRARTTRSSSRRPTPTPGPHDMGTFASRGTHRVGNAVKVAAAEALESILQLASEELEVAVTDLELDGAGSVRVVGSPDKTLGIADLASRAQFQYGRTIAGRGMWMKPKSEVDPDTGAMDPDSTQAYACTVAEVEVDTETGIVTVLRIRSAYEVGGR